MFILELLMSLLTAFFRCLLDAGSGRCQQVRGHVRGRPRGGTTRVRAYARHEHQ